MPGGRARRGRGLAVLRRERLLLRGHGDRLRLRLRRRPRLAAFGGQFGRCLDRRLGTGSALAELAELGHPRPLLHAVQDLLQILAHQRLLLQERTGQIVELVAVVVQDRPGLGVRDLDQAADLLVDLGRDARRIFGRAAAHAAPHERVALLVAVADRPEAAAHAVFGDHGARDLGGLIDVGAGAGGRLVEHQFLGRPATHRHHQARDHLRPRHQVLVLFGNRQRMTAGAPARQDGDLVDRIQVGHRPRGQRVTGLVIGHDLLLVFADHAALAARAADHPVDRLFEGLVGDDVLVLARGEQRRLVDHVGQVGAGHARRALGQTVQVGVVGDRLALGVHGQDGAPAGDVGVADRDLPVETARAQQRRVQDVGPVGRRHHDDAGTLAEAVHLHQQLVQRLLALVVTAAHAGAALAADGVDLVDEDDAGTVLLGLLEQVAHPGGADTDEHLDEVRTGDGVERHAGLAGHRPRQQRLTGAGRAVQQHALGDLGAQRLVAGRILQEVADLVEFLDGLVRAGDVGERGLGHVLGELLGLRLAEAHDAAAPALHAAHDEEEQAEQDHHRQHEDQQRLPDPRILGDVGLIRRAGGGRRLEDARGHPGRVLRLDLGDVLAVHRNRVLQGDPQPLLFVVDLDRLGVLDVQLRHRDGGVDAGVLAVVGAQRRKAPQGEDDHGHDGQIPVELLSVHTGTCGSARPAPGRGVRGPLSFPSYSLYEATFQRPGTLTLFPQGVTPRPPDGSVGVDGRVQTADERQIPVTLVVVQAVTHDELVLDVEAHVVDLHRQLHGLRLAQQRHHFQRPR